MQTSLHDIKNETGRNMVEMLGVLAVIGVLTIGGIYGYIFAMSKHKVNEAAELVTLAEVEMEAAASTGSQAELELSFLEDTSVSLEDSGLGYSAGAGTYSDPHHVVYPKKAGLIVDFEDDEAACKQFLKMYEGNPRFSVFGMCEEK